MTEEEEDGDPFKLLPYMIETMTLKMRARPPRDVDWLLGYFPVHPIIEGTVEDDENETDDEEMSDQDDTEDTGGKRPRKNAEPPRKPQNRGLGVYRKRPFPTEQASVREDSVQEKPCLHARVQFPNAEKRRKVIDVTSDTGV